MSRPTISVTMRELERIKIIQAVVDREFQIVRAGARLGLSTRQVRRLVRRYCESGPVGLTSRKLGRPSNHQLPEGAAEQAVAIITERYADFGPTLAREKLEERHGLRLAKETVRKLMIEARLWVPRKQRPARIFQPRNRRACRGELIQIDGSEHAWFEDRAGKCTALVFVDDATSELMALHFCAAESTLSYFVALRGYLQTHGKPLAFYSDKASIFRVNRPHATTGDGHTQFARALYELSIEGLCANTCQAKGRVERAHQTLQDRLVKELRLRHISSVADANAFAPEFIEDYNRRFAKLPQDATNAHRELRLDENLDLILTWREPRKVSKSLTLQYDRRLYLLEDSPDNRRLIGTYAEFYEYPDARLELRAGGRSLPYVLYDRLSNVDQGAIVDNKRLGRTLQIAHMVQEHRDNTRGQSLPSKRHLTGKAQPRKRPPNKKRQRELNHNDLCQAIDQLTNGR